MGTSAHGSTVCDIRFSGSKIKLPPTVSSDISNIPFSGKSLTLTCGFIVDDFVFQSKPVPAGWYYIVINIDV